MARLIRIGNSQGVRIPKPLVAQAGLEGRELDITVAKDGLWIRPARRPREGWAEAFANAHNAEDDTELLAGIGGNAFDDNDWEWA